MTVGNVQNAVENLAAVGPGGPARRLVLLFDGTWNKREDTTNVWRMKMMLRHNEDQLIYYDEGVGTARGERIVGGALGQGLSGKILNGYLWLMEHYEDATESERGVADELFIFGFSRGAFSARSLVGLLSISGLLQRDAATRIRDAFELSRIDGLHEGHRLAREFRRQHSREAKVRFLGVWDTVGALGIPRMKGLRSISLPLLEDNAHHKVVTLPSIVDHARHALALDERRMAFEPTLWPGAPLAKSMEQRWFCGAHANVGGGYDRDGLFLRPLQWIQTEARTLGLQFRKMVASLGDAFYGSMPRDSLDETLYGGYYMLQGFKPFDRTPQLGRLTNECLDYTVIERWLWNSSYSPATLQGILGHKPRGRPPRRELTDAEITSLLAARRVSGTRGYSF